MDLGKNLNKLKNIYDNQRNTIQAMRATINLFNQDCLLAMRKMADNQYNLCICDPPYGIGMDGQKADYTRKLHIRKKWDTIPTKEYFKELQRVSKNQIIWGGNYFTEYLKPQRAWVFWYKGQNGLSQSDGEMAWTSFDKVTRQININRFALKEQNTIHPTEKPIKLYKWLLKNYANEGDKILDTHGGSMSIAIACWDYGYDLDLWEIDKDYFEAGKKRLEIHKAQLKIF